jgi:hypothetical protein
MTVVAAPPRPTSHHRRKWAVDVVTTDRFEFEVYDAMRDWLVENVQRFRFAVVVRAKGMRSIKYIGFQNHADAVLFYLRFA